ncbi:cytochrome c [Roseovarius sp. S88]|uniref:Cytochrome c n=2 Tax=Roseovarius phycicola TaxID=3080976 RepID=A0ABZ2HFC2_9RHOB
MTCGLAAAALANTNTDRAPAELERLVLQDCGSCHGLTLKGGLGRPITPDVMQHFDREDLRDIILDGIPGTAMPPWRQVMTESEAMWIADYLQGRER